jgi:hypothetical protein
MQKGIPNHWLYAIKTTNTPWADSSFDTVSTIGEIRGVEICRAMGFAIRPSALRYFIGDRITFTFTFSNVGNRTFYLPRKPSVQVIWRHPDGSAGGVPVHVPPVHHFEYHDLVALQAGEQLLQEVYVVTASCITEGVTEFSAVARIPLNTNPAIRNVWQGVACSNTYGLVITDRDTRE